VEIPTPDKNGRAEVWVPAAQPRPVRMTLLADDGTSKRPISERTYTPAQVTQWEPAQALFSDSFDRPENSTIATNDNRLGGYFKAGYNPMECKGMSIMNDNVRFSTDDRSPSAKAAFGWGLWEGKLGIAITNAGGIAIECDMNPGMFGNGKGADWAALIIGPDDRTNLPPQKVNAKSTVFGIQLRDDGTYAAWSRGKAIGQGAFDTHELKANETYHLQLTLLTSSFRTGATGTISVAVSGDLAPQDGIETVGIDANGKERGFDFTFTWPDDRAAHLYMEGHLLSTIDNLKASTVRKVTPK
jgi:hypothetical protein